MISSEVKRTLVKSPPELWSELSDPAALARHLGELGEIKITKLEPEQSVEWEAEAAKGKVELKPSGWGTKVTLTMERDVQREATSTEADGGEGVKAPDSWAEASGAAEEELDIRNGVSGAAEEERPDVRDAVSSEAEDEEPGMRDGVSGETENEQPDMRDGVSGEAEDEQLDMRNGASGTEEDEQPQIPNGVSGEAGTERSARPGFFARLFKRRKHVETASVPPLDDEPSAVVELAGPDVAAEPGCDAAPLELESDAVLESGPDPVGEPEPDPEVTDAGSEGSPDLAAELAAAEEALVSQTTEMLTAILDRLGAAHHRPFSRS